MRQQYKETGVMPPSLASKPRLPLHIAVFMEAFIKLTRQRSSGFIENPIPFSDILAAMRYYRIEPDEQDFFIEAIQALDATFLQYRSEQRKQQEKSRVKGGSSGRGKR